MDHLSFKAIWFQEEASLNRNYILHYYKKDNSVEIFDQRTKRTFLRRTKVSDLNEKDFYVGSKLSIFGRQFDIVDFADDHTRNVLSKYRKKALILLKSSVTAKLGDVVCALIDSDFSINNGVMMQFTPEDVRIFVGDKTKNETEMSVLINQFLKGPSIALEVVGSDAVEKLRNCHNREGINSNPQNVPMMLSELFDGEDMRNGIYVAENEDTAAKNLHFFFESKLNLNIPLQLKNSTLAIIKPHSIKEGKLGKIIKEITTNGFKVTALRMHLLERPNCEEFYEVYRGVLQEYVPLVTQLSSGVCMALELTCSDSTKNTHEEFRKFCGPMDPQLARLLRPNTLRAKFGTNKVLNALHCTDLPEDTELELQYLFQILS